MENKIKFNKNQKDYCVKGYKQLSCDKFFLGRDNEEYHYHYFISTGEYNYFSITKTYQEILLDSIFPDLDIDPDVRKLLNLIGFRLIYEGKNSYNIDVVCGILYPPNKEILDFIPFCILFYRKQEDLGLVYGVWRRSPYTPGGDINYYIPLKGNIVFPNKTAIVTTNAKHMAYYKESIVYDNYRDAWNKMETYLEDFPYYEEMSIEDAELYNHALEYSFNLVTGKQIPEITINEGEIVKYTIDKIRI